MADLVDVNGLLYVWGKIKALIPKNVSDLKNDRGYLTKHQDLSSYATKVSIPDRTSQLTNDSGFLTAHQNLTGYATESFVKNALASINGASYEKVEDGVLPLTGKNGVRYLVPNPYNDKNRYDEYIWIDQDNSWEKLGGEVDLTGYIKESDIKIISNAQIDEICV